MAHAPTVIFIASCKWWIVMLSFYCKIKSCCLRDAKNGGGCSVKGSKRNDDDTTTIGERAWKDNIPGMSTKGPWTSCKVSSSFLSDLKSNLYSYISTAEFIFFHVLLSYKQEIGEGHRVKLKGPNHLLRGSHTSRTTWGLGGWWYDRNCTSKIAYGVFHSNS